MNVFFFSLKTNRNRILFFALFLFCASSFFAGAAPKTIKIKNEASVPLVDYTIEIPLKDLKLPLGSYRAIVKGQAVPLELSQTIMGAWVAVFPLDKIDPLQELEVTIEEGAAADYPKRTYAELSHKIGGQFEGNKYVGGYSWVKSNRMTLPGTFRDHSYYIKYEGPGWENDKVAFRFYLDNRNAIDVFGKQTKGIVLPAVGVDGFDNYHKLTYWGMDNAQVGNTLGLGSIAVWNGTKVARVETKDSMTCLIPTDGKIRAQVKTIYYGWDANGTKCNLTSLITIDAGSRASRMELLTDRLLDNLATGIIKLKNGDKISNNKTGEAWSYIATFGKQSLNNDLQGFAIFYRTKQAKAVTEDESNHVVVLTPEDGRVEYYFMPTWELDNEPVKTKEDFQRCLEEVLNRLNHPVKVTVK